MRNELPSQSFAPEGPKRRLPVFEPRGSLGADGRRIAIQPADVSGRFTRVRRIGFVLLIAIAAVLPWIPVGGHPAVFLDVPARRFYLFGGGFNAQDFWLVFFLLTGAAFALIVLTTVAGRVWCGFACPQTVLLEGFYRRVERWIEGPAAQRIKRRSQPLGFDRIWRAALKHGLFVVISFLIAHGALAYFASVPETFAMMQHSPAEHPEAFAWAIGVTGLLYADFGLLREHVCLIICPYGRLQSVLTDPDTLTVGYDARRGEPRGKVSARTRGEAGDCVDCKRCVAVCPTGIDIRDGAQIDCVGCTACIDACDAIMDRVGRPRGLVRYDTQRALAGEERRVLRPRLALYAVLGVAGVIAATLALRASTPFEAMLVRLPGPPYVVDGDRVRNTFELRLVNKRSEATTFTLDARAPDGTEVIVTRSTVELAPLAATRIPVVTVTAADAARVNGRVRVEVRARGAAPRTAEAQILRPSR